MSPTRPNPWVPVALLAAALLNLGPAAQGVRRPTSGPTPQATEDVDTRSGKDILLRSFGLPNAGGGPDRNPNIAETRAAARSAARRQRERYGPPTNTLLDVRDLVDTGGLDPATTEPLAGSSQPERTIAELADYLRSFVAPQLAPHEAVVALGPGHLAVRANAVGLASIRDILAELRARRADHVAVSLRILEMTEDRYETTLKGLMQGDFQTDEQGEAMAGAPRVLLSDSPPTRALLERVQRGVDVLSAPRILALNGHRAEVSTGERISYVRDYDVEIAGETAIADPVIDTLFDGIVFDVVAGSLPERRLGVDLDVTSGRVERPIPEFETTVGVPDSGKSRRVTLQLPTWTKHRLRVTVALPDRGTALFALPARGAAGERTRQVVMLRVELVKPRPKPAAPDARRTPARGRDR